MHGLWLGRLRRAHTFLSIFFTPLVVMFLLSGLWQSVIPEDEREKPGMFRMLAEDFSKVHTDGYFPRAGEADPSTAVFKVLVVALCVALVISIVLGLILAWNSSRNKWWALLALGLGILVPAMILWLA